MDQLSFNLEVSVKCCLAQQWHIKQLRYSCQLTVRASDNGIPSYSDDATVTIRIIRAGRPYFRTQEYRIIRQESLPVNASIINVEAVDPQGVSKSVSSLVRLVMFSGLCRMSVYFIYYFSSVMRYTESSDPFHRSIR